MPESYKRAGFELAMWRGNNHRFRVRDDHYKPTSGYGVYY